MIAYINSLPLNIELSCGGKDWLLVHGGLLDDLRKQYGDGNDELLKYHAVWHRIGKSEIMPKGKTVVFGHAPTFNYQDNEPMEIFYGEGKIGIDCGCAYDDGRLACLRLDDGAVVYSN